MADKLPIDPALRRKMWDSPDLADKHTAEMVELLGEYAHRAEVNAWLDPNRQRFSKDVVLPILNSWSDDFDEDMLNVKGENPNSDVNESMRTLCSSATQDFKKYGRKGNFGGLLEYFKEYWLRKALNNPESREVLEESSFQNEIVDGIVVETVLSTFYEHLQNPDVEEDEE